MDLVTHMCHKRRSSWRRAVQVCCHALPAAYLVWCAVFCRLEAQLQEALAHRDVHKPAIDIDTPADKTLKLLDKIMRGLDVSGCS